MSPKRSSDYDLLFQISDGSLPTSLAKKTIIHFQFPIQNVHGKSIRNRVKSKFYKFVVNSFFTKKVIDQEFGVNSQVIYPPVDIFGFKPGAKKKYILYVGRFSNLMQHKGQEHLIKAFSNISSQLAGWKLVLAGGVGVGTETEQLDSLKKQSLGMPIELITNPSLMQLKSLYSSAAIFCSASGFGIDEELEPLKTEHFGISVVEAMAAGCVPVITNIGGHKEIVNSGKNGYLFDTLDHLQEKLISLAKSPPLLKALAQEAVVKSKIFDVQEFNNQFAKLI
jgi:glycosyltransferase involved in cell wall biosynthesis